MENSIDAAAGLNSIAYNPNERSLRLVFDAYWWTEGPSSLRRCAREIILAWRNVFPEDELILLVRRKHGKPNDAPQGVTLAYSRLYPHAVFASFGCTLLGKRTRSDAVLVHNYGSSFGLCAVFIHDFLFLSNPEFFTWPERIYFRPMKWLAHRSTITFTSTASEAKRMTMFGVRDPIPVGLGVAIDPHYPGNKPQELAELTTNGFFLTVGRLNVRKNLRKVIEATLLTGMASAERPLVIVGSENGSKESLLEFQDEFKSGILRIIPFVDESSLVWLYQNAAVFIYASLGEGFGLPPVEAASVGCPVVVTDICVFHETLGNYPIFCDPNDAADMAAAIQRALIRPRSDWVQADTTRYSWANVAKRMRRAFIERTDPSLDTFDVT